MSTFMAIDDPVKVDQPCPVKSRNLEDRNAYIQAQWGDLFGELISMIADRLGLIDLLSFRAVCKSWRSSSTTSSAEIESEINSNPSFLVHGEDDKFDFYYRSREMKMYSISIPELEKSICLASNYGWLLMLKENLIFFFCPFTRAKIDLPPFPYSDISEHFAAFSAPPTSPDCVLLAVNPCNGKKVEMHVLRRGGSNWIKEKDYTGFGSEISKITGVFYDKAYSSFSFMDDTDTLLLFSLKEESWTPYTIIHNEEPAIKTWAPNTTLLRFSCVKRYFSNMQPWLSSTGGRLEEKTPIAICGTTFPATTRPVVVYNQSISVATGVHHLKGIWFHPRAFHISPHFRF